MEGAFPGAGMGGTPQIFNLQQIGGALGIFAVLDKFFGGNPYLSAGFGILIITTLYPEKQNMQETYPMHIYKLNQTY